MTPLRHTEENARREVAYTAKNDIADELSVAMARFPPFNSPHEGWAVLFEEVDELWDEVKANRGCSASARAEAVQVAAMALRFIIDISDRHLWEDRDRGPQP